MSGAFRHNRNRGGAGITIGAILLIAICVLAMVVLTGHG